MVCDCHIRRPGGCESCLLGTGHRRLGYRERTAASASWLATFSSAVGLPWPLARSCLLSDLNPLQAATFLSASHAPPLLLQPCSVYPWCSSVQKGSRQCACLPQGWTFCCLSPARPEPLGIQPRFPCGFCSPCCI